jgi:hypothetical protein
VYKGKEVFKEINIDMDIEGNPLPQKLEKTDSFACVPGGRPNDGEGKSREGSIGSQEGIQLSEIKIITKHHESEEEEEDSDEDSENEEEIKPKKKVKRKKVKREAQPADVVVSTLAKAIRMINEQKEKERQKIKKEAIRKMALEQKKRQEIAGPGRVLIHI